jgi:oligopeptide/dipeptide ABC transporter ATP-binding protein
MYAGKIVEIGPVMDVFHNAKHPYTQGLLQSIPKLGSSMDRKNRLDVIEGMVPNLLHLPQGCAFAPRCGQAAAPCGTQPPRLRAVGEHRRVACVIDQHAGATDIIGQAAE